MSRPSNGAALAAPAHRYHRRMHALRFLFAALCVLATPAAVQASELGPLAFEATWIRAAPPSAPVMVGYVRIVNRDSDEFAIAAFASSAFGAVELHEMRDVDGVMRMRAVPELRVAPGSSVSLEPGGLHLMLMRPVRDLGAGEQVQIEFVLSDGRRQQVEFEVRPAR